MDAEEVADLIADEGNTVWIGEDGDATDGEVESVTAIVDERLASIRRQFPEGVTELKGRLAIFYLSEADYQKIPRGETLVYDGLKWSHQQTASGRTSNVVTERACLYSTGGTL